jgi:hypothetical protein
LFKRYPDDAGFGARNVLLKGELTAVMYPVLRDGGGPTPAPTPFLHATYHDTKVWDDHPDAHKYFPHDMDVNKAANLDHSPLTFTPVDYKDVEGGSIHGMPMWCNLPFDLVKASALSGIG